MNKQRRQLIISGCLGIGLTQFNTVAFGQTAQFIAVRTWLSQEYTRLAVEFNGVLLVDELVMQPVASATQLPVKGKAVQFDMLGLEFSAQLEAAFLQRQFGSLIKHIQVQPIHSGSRLTLWLDTTAQLEMSVVGAVGPYRQRVLFDVYPNIADPIQAWLSQQQLRELKTAHLPNSNTAIPQSTLKNAKKRVLVIDPGHGGEDPGAIGPTGVMEKDVTLSMAMQLAALVRKRLGWTIVLTRDADYFVPLAQRVGKARAAQADLMVSIHADAFLNPNARGASVFALSEKGATSTTAKWLAAKENDADLVGGLNIRHKDKQLMGVLLDLSTTSQIKRSKQLGAHVLTHLGKIGHVHKKQVEQAGFAVLKAPDVPSILIETAFISHPEEEKLLNNNTFQMQVVTAIVDGFKQISWV